MLKRSSIILLFCVIAVVLWSCTDRNPSFRYKMTVYVSTPAGIQSGSSVTEMGLKQTISPAIDDALKILRFLSRGDAVFIDLPDATLIATTWIPNGGGQVSGRAQQALDPKGAFGDREGQFRSYYRLRRGKHSADLPRMYWPVLLTMDRNNDPATLRAVDPEEVGVTKISIETTHEAATTDIEKRLGPLNAFASRVPQSVRKLCPYPTPYLFSWGAHLNKNW